GPISHAPSATPHIPAPSGNYRPLARPIVLRPRLLPVPDDASCHDSFCSPRYSFLGAGPCPTAPAAPLTTFCSPRYSFLGAGPCLAAPATILTLPISLLKAS